MRVAIVGSLTSFFTTAAGYKLEVGVNKQKRILELTVAVVTVVGVAVLAAVAVTWASCGPTAFVDAVAKSGFSAAFALFFVSEIGDKTFFIAALLALRHAKILPSAYCASWLFESATFALINEVLLGASAAVAMMTIISVAIGRIFQAVPAHLRTTLPIGEYAAVALLVFFGLKSLKKAWDLPAAPSKDMRKDSFEMRELNEAEEVLKKAEVNQTSTPFEILWETFSLVFLAEWGDRSMLATIALGAAQAPVSVATGAIAGQVIATGLAILGGAFLAQYISEKMVHYIGGFLFLAFAAATLLGAL
ncbi:hypothetical protein GOP47_0014730 [Adiantum capillus-veneris]|uniref:GDT1 family protein n=1 Tax=Adiantum capillus-veneris TaxID=13818 RepID=A0A9D4ZDS3_ADICA|nr:hypothetical protein GOP47_0014730 [Adiantum capillus-veneris]